MAPKCKFLVVYKTLVECRSGVTNVQMNEFNGILPTIRAGSTVRQTRRPPRAPSFYGPGGAEIRDAKKQTNKTKTKQKNDATEKERARLIEKGEE